MAELVYRSGLSRPLFSSEADGNIAELAARIEAGANNTTKWMSNFWAFEGVPNPITVANYLNDYESFTVTAVQSRVYYRFLVVQGDVSYQYLFDFGGGKGTWGAGVATDVTSAMIKLLAVYPVVPGDIEDNDQTIIEPLGEIAEDGFLAATNVDEHDFSDTDVQYYFSYYIDDVLYLALFIGAPGVYGGAGMPFVNEDFAQVTNGNVTPVLTLEDVTAAGARTGYAMTVYGDGAETELQDNGLLFTGANDKTVKIKLNQVEADLIIQTPENKTGLETQAMLSDLFLQKILEGGSEAEISTPFVIIFDNGTQSATFQMTPANMLFGSTVPFAFSGSNSFSVSVGGDINLNTSGTLKYNGTKVATITDLLNHPKILHCDIVDSSTLTGTTTETVLGSYLLPANTGNGVIDFSAMFSKTGLGGASEIKVYMHTSGGAVAGTQIGLYTTTAAARSVGFSRRLLLKSGTLVCFPGNISAVTDTQVNNAMASVSFNPAINNYFIITGLLVNVADTFAQRSATLIFNKSV